jgi:hypothetical protein
MKPLSRIQKKLLIYGFITICSTLGGALVLRKEITFKERKEVAIFDDFERENERRKANKMILLKYEDSIPEHLRDRYLFWKHSQEK